CTRWLHYYAMDYW
nr:immunoglobulin heavy chain junction region [Mus musculus]